MGRKWWICCLVTAAVGLITATTLSGCAGKEQLPVFSATAPSIPAAEPVGEELSLPWILEGGQLEVQELVCFEGAIPGAEEWADCAALMLKNTSDKDLKRAMIAVRQEKKTLYFYVSWLPAGEQVLIPEFRGQSCGGGEMTACRILQVQWAPVCREDERLCIFYDPEMGLTVANVSGQSISQVTLRLRATTEEGFFLGAQATEIYVPQLAPGETRSLPESKFGGNIVVSVEIT